MENISANGFVVAWEKNHPTNESEVQIYFESMQVFFIHNMRHYAITTNNNRMLCSLVSGKKQQTKQIICNDYRHVLQHILRVQNRDDLNIQYGTINIKDIPFVFHIIPNGFLFKLDIADSMITYAIVNQENKILLAKQEGQWQFNNATERAQILAECDDFFEPLKLIYEEALQMIQETLKKRPLLIN